MSVRRTRPAVPFLLSVVLAAGIAAWLAAVFGGVTVRYESMLSGGSAVSASADAVTCPAITGETVDALRDRSVVPLLALLFGSLLAVVVAASDDRRARRPSAWVPAIGAVTTLVGVGCTYEAITLGSVADALLRFVAPVVAVLLLVAAALIRSPSDPASRRATFPLMHAAVVALLLPSAVAWLTPTHEAFVCL